MTRQVGHVLACYPAVNIGYAGTANIRGSDIGGMVNDNVHGMPTFNTMYVTQ